MKTKRKNPIKVEKQKLIDKINACKSLKEIKEYKKTFSYHNILKDDEEWDYDFFLTLIEFKLKRMRQYFWTHNIVVNEKEYGNICNRLINILNAGYKTDKILSSDLKTYVNPRNYKRFLRKYQCKHFINNDEYWNKYGLASIREAKAKALFWKYLEHNIERLWD